MKHIDAKDLVTREPMVLEFAEIQTITGEFTPDTETIIVTKDKRVMLGPPALECFARLCEAATDREMLWTMFIGAE